MLIKPELQAILDVLISHDIDVVLRPDHIRVDGFYKSGDVRLYQKDNIVALDRYDKETTIYSIDDLVWLNFDWWEITCKRMGGVVDPGKWKGLLIEHKLIEEVTYTTFERTNRG